MQTIADALPLDWAAAMAVSDMVKLGQKEIKSTDDALKRSQRIVEDTIQVDRVWELCPLIGGTSLDLHLRTVLRCVHTKKGTHRYRRWHHQVATETAATLDGQTKQMETVLDSLDEIHFSLKKANQVIRDITRRIATDKCVTVWLCCTLHCGTVELLPLHDEAPRVDIAPPS